MAIATRPKPSVHHKKRRALHHRHSKLYLKPYWPYLPIIAIVGIGAAVNKALYGVNFGSGGWLASSTPLAPTRIDALTGRPVWGELVIIISIVAAVIFVASHWYRFRRLLNRGEAFIAHHPWFDIILVIILTVGVILTRNA